MIDSTGPPGETQSLFFKIRLLRPPASSESFETSEAEASTCDENINNSTLAFDSCSTVTKSMGKFPTKPLPPPFPLWRERLLFSLAFNFA